MGDSLPLQALAKKLPPTYSKLSHAEPPTKSSIASAMPCPSLKLFSPTCGNAQKSKMRKSPAVFVEAKKLSKI